MSESKSVLDKLPPSFTGKFKNELLVDGIPLHPDPYYVEGEADEDKLVRMRYHYASGENERWLHHYYLVPDADTLTRWRSSVRSRFFVELATVMPTVRRGFWEVLFGDDDAPILPGAPSTIVDDYVKVFPDQKDEVEFVQARHKTMVGGGIAGAIIGAGLGMKPALGFPRLSFALMGAGMMGVVLYHLAGEVPYLMSPSAFRYDAEQTNQRIMNFWEQKYIEDRVREKQSKSLNVPSAIADMIENSSPPKDAQEIQKEDIRLMEALKFYSDLVQNCPITQRKKAEYGLKERPKSNFTWKKE